VFLRGITQFNIEKAVNASSHQAFIDISKCSGCGECLKKCQVKALSFDGDTAILSVSDVDYAAEYVIQKQS